jgi:hypothetical protein
LGQTAIEPDALPEPPVELADPLAAAKFGVANVPVLAVAASAVYVIAGSVANPTAARAARAANNPIASFFIISLSNITYIYRFCRIVLNYTFSNAIHCKDL